MLEPLLGPRIKLERAKHHLVELERIESDFFDANLCRIVFDTDTQPGHKLVKLVLNAQPPELIHVLAGELIYQLRSALDQTAVAFARLSAGPTKASKVYFPTGDNAKAFISSCKGEFRPTKTVPFFRGLRHFDADLRKAVMRTHAYDGGNADLRAVFRLANIDKHMELIAIGSRGQLAGQLNIVVQNAFTGFIMAGGDLNEGVVISDLKPDGVFQIGNSQDQVKVAGQISLGKGTPFPGEPLVPFLKRLIDAVASAHANFESLLIARGDMRPRIIFWPPADNTLTRGGLHQSVTPVC